MILRIVASLILLLSILFLPFWVYALLALGAIIYFRYFLEAVFILLFSDVFYAAQESKLYGIVFVSFLLSVVTVVLVELLKSKMKFHSK